MGISWGTCTMANIGPSTTLSYAVNALGGSSISSWIPNAALIPLIALQPVWGTLADRFGKRWFIFTGGVFGVVGNVVSGTAKSVEVIIVSQAITGVASSLFLLAIPASMEIVLARQRSFAQGLMGSINGVMAIAVLLVAGAFAKMSESGWRWVYYLNAILFGTCALGIVALYRPPPPRLRRDYSTKTVLKSVDVVGIFLLVCGIVMIVTSLTWGGHAYPWNDSKVVSLLTLGAAFLVGFGIYETYGRRDGLIDHRFLESRNFLLILSVAFIDGMLLYGVNVFLPQEVTGLFTHDPVMVSIYLLPLNVCLIGGILISSYVLGVLKHYRVLLVSSVLLITLFCGLLALVTPSRAAIMLVFTGLIGLGVGVTTVIPPVILTYAVPSHLLGTAGTLLASIRALGGIIGITIFATINSNYVQANQVPSITDAVVKAGFPRSSVDDFVAKFISGDTDGITAITGATPAIIAAAEQALKLMTARSFRFVWIANAVIGLVTAGLTAFLQPVISSMTAHVEVPLEEGKWRDKAME
ncbi:hypothetical protein AK830_g5098 [Neonectria ditissima]|uniref:Major facilitator superfamily (MFS) profile domain-containing protein n=1 Tax=Neonectria ditissima TaxID=78410 RepID=A0A0N8H7D5_9HYPO|nr:hypothetical protein AK830_g5098 [Neonectria ditissima]